MPSAKCLVAMLRYFEFEMNAIYLNVAHRSYVIVGTGEREEKVESMDIAESALLHFEEGVGCYNI